MRTEIKIYCVFVWKLAAFYLCVHFMEGKKLSRFFVFIPCKPFRIIIHLLTNQINTH